jgi:hypothetical protein
MAEHPRRKEYETELASLTRDLAALEELGYRFFSTSPLTAETDVTEEYKDHLRKSIALYAEILGMENPASAKNH